MFVFVSAMTTLYSVSVTMLLFVALAAVSDAFLKFTVNLFWEFCPSYDQEKNIEFI